jgi:hypothetical protein
MRRRIAAAAALIPLSSGAADIERLEVSRRGDRFGLSMVAWVDAPRNAVWSALTAYPQLCRLAKAVRRSDLLDSEADGRPLLYTRSRVCIWVFCREFLHVQRMLEYAPKRLEADTVPDLSDFAFGRTLWDLGDAGPRTRFELNAELRPGFWVPPVIGPILVKQGLESSALEALEGLERAARSRL